MVLGQNEFRHVVRGHGIEANTTQARTRILKVVLGVSTAPDESVEMHSVTKVQRRFGREGAEVYRRKIELGVYRQNFAPNIYLINKLSCAAYYRRHMESLDACHVRTGARCPEVVKDPHAFCQSPIGTSARVDGPDSRRYHISTMRRYMRTDTGCLLRTVVQVLL